jgi:hypothetical protein
VIYCADDTAKAFYFFYAVVFCRAFKQDNFMDEWFWLDKTAALVQPGNATKITFTKRNC